MFRLSFLFASSAVAVQTQKMNVVDTLAQQMEGIKMLGNFLPEEQRPMISLLGKVIIWQNRIKISFFRSKMQFFFTKSLIFIDAKKGSQGWSAS